MEMVQILKQELEENGLTVREDGSEDEHAFYFEVIDLHGNACEYQAVKGNGEYVWNWRYQGNEDWIYADYVSEKYLQEKALY